MRRTSGPTTIPITANDYDPENGAISLVSVTALYGSAVPGPGEAITYTPPTGAEVSDTIIYEIIDPADNTATATVSVEILDPQVVVHAIGPQDPNGDIAVSYTVAANVICETVLFLATESIPLASHFAGGSPAYISIGQVAFTTTGTGIILAVPDGLDGNYKLGFLPSGGTDLDVIESPAVMIDTVVAAPAGITPVFLSGAVSGATSLAFTETLAMNMSAYSGADDLIIMFATWGGNATAKTNTLTLDGKSPTAIYTLPVASSNGIQVGYAVFAAQPFAATSNLVLTHNQQMYDAGAAIYTIPAGSTVTVLTPQPETMRTGSSLSGSVAAGNGVIAVQQVQNGMSATWTGLAKNYEADIRIDEWFTTASAGDVTAASSFTISTTGNSAKTAALSVRIS